MYDYHGQKNHILLRSPKNCVTETSSSTTANMYNYLARTSTSPTSTMNLFRPKRMLRRYNLEATSVNVCLRCLRCSCFAPCSNCHSFPCRQLVGHPESGSAPPSFARIRTLLLCIGISIELPEPECCRGTVFVTVAVAPLSFPP